LESVRVDVDAPGVIRVHDAAGRCYGQWEGSRVDLCVSGAVGVHVVTHHNAAGAETARATFTVHCQTEIGEPSGRFERFTRILRNQFILTRSRAGHVLRDGERTYHMFSVASRDNVHAVKGAMYFLPEMTDGLDLHARYQREDGLIWDFAGPATPGVVHQHQWRWEPQFSARSDDGHISFGRQPAENDVEHQHIRGIWRVWKCTGDDEWMRGKLDSALKAMRFSGSDEWFWSEKYRLLKRPYTIDTWDFVSQFDRYRTELSGDCGLAKPGVTVYGIMHGDNTGMADACEKLAECCRFAGRDADADEALAFAAGLRERLDEVAWNGEFFTHHVSEDPTYERDFGVDESTQVSLSNAYALSRGIRHDQAVAILRTYQRIRDEAPQTSPGEWYMIFPPFQRGWGPAASPWQYANGSVTGIVAGELARGAFEHGFEEYGADVLDRWLDWMVEFDDTIPWSLRGAMPTPPQRTFRPVDLRPLANADLACRGDGVPGWMDDPGMDLRELPRGEQVFDGVRFDVIDEEENDRRSLLRLARGREGFAESATIPASGKVGSVYLLHAVSGAGPIAGEVRFRYADGGERTAYVVPGRDVYPEWQPTQIPGRDRSLARKDYLTTVIAWRGACPRFWNIGLTACGIDNPDPDRDVTDIELRAAEGPAWLVVAATLCDAHAFFMPGREAHGVPQAWSGGALACALYEGLAGVVDTDRNLLGVRLSPRWSAAGVDDVTACVHYAHGGGYVRYRYQRRGETLRLHLAGNADRRRVELLLPPGKQAAGARVDGRPVDVETRTIEQSTYACLDADTLAAVLVEVDLA
jgi:hypothetical protein